MSASAPFSIAVTVTATVPFFVLVYANGRTARPAQQDGQEHPRFRRAQFQRDAVPAHGQRAQHPEVHSRLRIRRQPL
ncbi:hypothetical protein ACIBO4_07140 [Streptomyces sp. NPDC050149]|uniref:hypothetical protein n=1 Tax=Streptomyces sp. NPDC050149 TaxID=3365603 RepID=UPI0037BDEF4F